MSKVFQILIALNIFVRRHGIAFFRTKINKAILTFSIFITTTVLFFNSFANSYESQTVYKPGQVFQDCIECPELVVIPSGSFIMGHRATSKNSQPAHPVQITKPFAIGRFEIKFSEWQKCIDGGGCKNNPDDHQWGRKNRPVINITYYDAKNYISWLSNKTGYVYRLPSEAEWAYANRGGTNTLWWWGDKVGKNHANCKDCLSPWSDGGGEITAQLQWVCFCQIPLVYTILRQMFSNG